MEWYNKSAEDALREQNVDAVQGLTSSAAKHRLERYGENVWPRKNGGMTEIILAQLTDFLSVLTILAMLLALISRQYVSALLFLCAAAARIVPGILQDSRASLEVETLDGITPATARVMRDGRACTLPTSQLVPGDIVLLEAGDIVPADLRLTRTVSLQIDEFVITGSRQAVFKEAEAVLPGPAPAEDRVNMAYVGSAVIYGRGQGVVVATGAKTELGQVADVLHTAPANESAGRLRGIGQGIGIICVLGWAVLLITALVRRETGEVTGRMAAFAAAALPAGLAPAATLSLVTGMQRIRQRGAQLKRLASAEALGAVNVICADKSGTLTKNEMTATLLWTGEHLTTVDGSGYAPVGKFHTAKGADVQPLRRRDLIMTITAAALCNNASLEETAVDTWSAVGNPTEAALVALAAKAGLEKSVLDTTFPRVAEIPFDAERRMMTTIHRGNHFPVAYSKGAAREIMERCDEFEYSDRRVPMTDELRRKIMAIDRLMEEQAMRVLAVAYREFSEAPNAGTPEELEQHMVFLGLIGMIDPARPDSEEAVAKCRRAGIRTMLVTGESRDTAAALARTVGIIGADDSVVTGPELDEMSDGTLRSVVRSTRVFACMATQHKQRVLDALHRNGDIVAMTGDGVSDVPLLRHADIGIAKGRTGTEIARSSADLVADDDKFSTAVAAIGVGRTFYENIRRVAKLLLGASTAGALTALAATLAGCELPFPTTAALLCGLVLFSLPAFVIGRQSGEKDAMKRPPRATGCVPLTWSMVVEIAAQALVQTLGCVVMLALSKKLMPEGADETLFRTTAVFSVYCISTLLCAFSASSAREPMWKPCSSADGLMLAVSSVLGILIHILCVSASGLAKLLGMTPLGGGTTAMVLLISVLVLVLVEAFKLFLLPSILGAFPALERGPKNPPRERRSWEQEKERTGSADPTQDSEEQELPEESDAGSANPEEPEEILPEPDSGAEGAPEDTAAEAAAKAAAEADDSAADFPESVLSGFDPESEIPLDSAGVDEALPEESGEEI